MNNDTLSFRIIDMQAVNWSCIAVGIPFVWKVEVRNNSTHRSHPTKIRFEIKNKAIRYLDSHWTHIPAIEARDCTTITISTRQWCDYPAVMRLRETTQATLSIWVENHKIVRSVDMLSPQEWASGIGVQGNPPDFVRNRYVPTCEITFRLPIRTRLFGAKREQAVEKEEFKQREWKGEPPLEIATAAFVQPHHKKIDDLIRTVQSRVSPLHGNAFVPLERLAVGTPQDRTSLVVGTLAAIGQKYPCLFHAIEDIGFTSWCQRLRSFDSVLACPNAQGDQEEGGQGATCIEFALIACSVLIKLGLRVFLVVVGVGNSGGHALLIVETASNALPRKSLFIGDADLASIRKEIKAKTLLPIDVTAFFHAHLPPQNDFEYACSEGEKCLLTADHHFFYALDPAQCWKQYKFGPLVECARKQSQRTFQQRAGLTVSIAGAMLLASLFHSAGLPPIRIARITQIQGKAISSNTTNLLIGNGHAQCLVSGRVEGALEPDDRLFLVRVEQDSSTVIVPIAMNADGWNVSIDVAPSDRADETQIKLIPVIAQGRPGDQSILDSAHHSPVKECVLVVRTAKVSIQASTTHASPYADVSGTAPNLPDGARLAVHIRGDETSEESTSNMSTPDSGETLFAPVKAHKWRLPRLPIRQPYMSGGIYFIQAIARVKENAEFGLLTDAESAEAKVPIDDPKIAVTRARFENGGVTASGYALGLLPQENLWLYVVSLEETGGGWPARILPGSNGQWTAQVIPTQGAKFTVYTFLSDSAPNDYPQGLGNGIQVKRK